MKGSILIFFLSITFKLYSQNEDSLSLYLVFSKDYKVNEYFSLEVKNERNCGIFMDYPIGHVLLWLEKDGKKTYQSMSKVNEVNQVILFKSKLFLDKNSVLTFTFPYTLKELFGVKIESGNYKIGGVFLGEGYYQDNHNNNINIFSYKSGDYFEMKKLKKLDYVEIIIK